MPTPIHINIHYTVLHEFCTVYCSRVYAVHCAVHMSCCRCCNPCFCRGRPSDRSQPLRRSSFLNPQPTLSTGSRDGHLNSSCITDFKSWLKFIFKRGFGFQGVCQGGDWITITHVCLHQKLAVAVGGRFSCGCCSCFCPQNL